MFDVQSIDLPGLAVDVAIVCIALTTDNDSPPIKVRVALAGVVFANAAVARFLPPLEIP